MADAAAHPRSACGCNVAPGRPAPCGAQRLRLRLPPPPQPRRAIAARGRCLIVPISCPILAICAPHAHAGSTRARCGS
ncbi:hypothetical protein MYA_2813 [Burkholderia sp. KJ006]|nr:hypothetical protein MYA_2813 [Burkholderia sp. KJ006]